MTGDRAAFAVGVVAVVISALALWSVYGQPDLRVVGFVVPAALVVIGVGMLTLTHRRN